MADWNDLVTQLSGARIGQGDNGRVANVSGYLLETTIGRNWLTLAKRKQNELVSESAPMLRGQYEAYLRRDYKTKEAADLAMKNELKRLAAKYPRS